MCETLEYKPCTTDNHLLVFTDHRGWSHTNHFIPGVFLVVDRCLDALILALPTRTPQGSVKTEMLMTRQRTIVIRVAVEMDAASPERPACGDHVEISRQKITFSLFHAPSCVQICQCTY